MKILIFSLLLIPLVTSAANSRLIQLDELDSAILYYTLDEAGVLVEYREDHSSIQTGPVNCKNMKCQVENLMFFLKADLSNKVSAIFVENKVESRVLDILCTATFILSDAPNCKLVVEN